MGLPISGLHGEREILHAVLIDKAVGHVNDDWLARIYATWAAGGGALPDWLGLTPAVFRAMMQFHFPGFTLADPPGKGHCLALDRCPEIDDLRRLLLDHRARESVSEAWVAQIVTVACMGTDHLWQDLGVWSRGELSGLLLRNFPALARRNVKDMKWKKFLYKQLCEAEGIYVCRAPSCDACVDYDLCFGPEE